MYCWGSGSNGRLGNNATANSPAPVSVDTSGALNGKTVVQVSAGGAHACAATSDGGAYCWGSGANGRLGNNATADSAVPVAVATSGVLNGKTVVQVSAGGDFTCAVTSDGGAYCWGSGISGRLGNNATANSLVPVAVNTTGVLNGKTVVQLDSGAGGSCAITSEGRAYCWGIGSSGALGNNTAIPSTVPVAVDTNGVLNGKFVSQIEAGYLRACVTTSDGGAYCWGAANNGALGNNATSPNALVPVAVNASGVLSEKFVSQASTANSTVAAGSFSNAVAPAGGPGRAIAAGPTAAWQQMGTVCTPSGSATVADVFGGGSPMNLTTADYNVANPGASQGWVVFRFNPSTNQYVRLAATDTLSLGTGYWLRSYQRGRQGKLIMNCPDTAPQAPVTQADGCASTNGCVAIPLPSVAGVDRSNLIGNPFPYAVDWSQVRVRIDGAGSYTPSQAARLAGSGDAPIAVISNVFNVWNGTSYASYSDSGVTAGQLPYFSSFWAKVLSGAFGHTVELLIPKLPTQTASPF